MVKKKKRSQLRWFLGKFVAVGVILFSQPALATFHLMQIEQVIGGVNGDVTAQAIQLRLRSASQNQVSQARMYAWDAAGANPILVIDFTEDISNTAAGTRILIASPSFIAATNPQAVVDFPIEHLIPESYLAAGSLTFEDDLGGVLWRLSWGGGSYAGPTDVSFFNDLDQNSAPPFPNPLPSNSLQALKFKFAANVRSTNNAADYAVTDTAAVFGNSTGGTFTVAGLPDVRGDLNGDRHIDLADAAIMVHCLAGPDLASPPPDCSPQEFDRADLNADSQVDLLDYAEFETLFATH